MDGIANPCHVAVHEQRVSTRPMKTERLAVDPTIAHRPRATGRAAKRNRKIVDDSREGIAKFRSGRPGHAVAVGWLGPTPVRPKPSWHLEADRIGILRGVVGLATANAFENHDRLAQTVSDIRDTIAAGHQR